MSADPEDIQDFEQVASISPPSKKEKPAQKLTAPPKRAARSEADIRAEVEADLAKEAELRARIEAEVRARLEAEYQARLAETEAKADASTVGVDETPYVHIVPGPGEEVIHMVEDGLTFGNKVYMRGEELALNPEEHPWMNYPRARQVKDFGKQLYSKGPWPYGGYDLTDENLTPQDKQKLLQLTESFA